MIIPVHNRAQMLEECVASVLEQSHPSVEIIIVDDGSTDETTDVAHRLAKQSPSIHLVRRQNRSGPGAARETGRLRATGELIKYLDSDDILLPDCLRLQVDALQRDAEAGAAYGWTRFRRSDLTVDPNPLKGTGTVHRYMFPEMLRWRWWSTPNPLWRRVVIDRAGPWANLVREEDWEYDARIASFGTKLAYVPDWVVEVRDHDSKLTKESPRAPEVYHARAVAHEMILEHALTGGVERDSPEMAHFVRELFLLARQSASVGLSADAQRLLDLALSIDPAQSDAETYRAVSRLAGWRRVGTLAALRDRFR